MKPEASLLEKYFYGTATLGERGQIVIPADARKDCEMNPTDKVLVFRHPLHPRMLILAKVGEMEQMLQQMHRAITQLQAQVSDAETENA